MSIEALCGAVFIEILVFVILGNLTITIFSFDILSRNSIIFICQQKELTIISLDVFLNSIIAESTVGWVLCKSDLLCLLVLLSVQQYLVSV